MKLSFKTVNNGDQLPEVVRETNQEIMWRHAVTSFDWNPVHINPDWCRTAKVFGLESTVMHGNLAFSLITSVVTNWAYPAGGRISKLDIKLLKPVPPGSTIRYGGAVTEKHPIEAGKNFVVVEIYGKNQDDETIAAATAEVILP